MLRRKEAMAQDFHSNFFTRLSAIPIVSSGINYATGLYGKAKNYGGLVGKTITMAESMTTAAAERAIPLFSPLAQPLSKVDEYATLGLAKLEQKVPAINKEPKQMLDDTKGLINGVTHPAVEKIQGVSGYLVGKFNKARDMIIGLFAQTAEVFLDFFFPQKSVEGKVANGAPHAEEKSFLSNPQEKVANVVKSAKRAVKKMKDRHPVENEAVNGDAKKEN